MSERPRGYPARWESDAILADGGTVHLRPIRPGDEAALGALNERLSTVSLHRRFFTASPDLGPEQLERFTHVDYVGRMALVAEVDGTVVGVGRYDRLADPHEAEVAFVIEDAHQGRGIGTLMLEHLAVIAHQYGVRDFVAEVLPENHDMLDVFSDAGFRTQRSSGEGVVHVRLSLDPTRVTSEASEAREHHSEAASIRRLLRPRSVAVVGAGRRGGTIGHEILRNLLRFGFQGPVYPVNPAADSVASVPAFPDLAAVPGPVDMAVIAVPSRHVLDALDDCVEAGVYSLVVVTAGFAEQDTDGATLQRRLLQRARAHGMRVVGPNCMGVLNTDPAVQLNATFAPTPPEPGHVGFMTQSGGLGIAILDWSRRLGIGVSSFASVGNKADVSGNDLLQYWEEDDATRVALLYLESFGNPRKFARLCRRISKRKPIVVVKSGRTRVGARAASSHTAALASEDVTVDALFGQAGVIRVPTVQQMFELAQFLSHQPLPRGRGVAIVGNAGGPGILAADACAGAGLDVPTLADATTDELRRFLPPGAATANPVDMIASATAKDYRRALRLVLDDPDVDAALVIFTPPLVTRAEDVAEAVADVARDATKPVVASFLGLEGVPDQLRRDDRAVPSYPFPEGAARVLARAVEHAEWRARPVGTVPELPGFDLEAARAIVTSALAGEPDGCWLDADDVFAVCAAVGIPVPTTEVVADADEAAAAAERIAAPVALKAASGELVHKTDVGGVVLDVRGAGATRDAFRSMHERLGSAMGGALVQSMAPAGVETIIGVTHDPSFGPFVLFGMGGTGAELVRDRTLQAVPVTDTDAARLVRGLQTSPLLLGYRNQPPVDTAALEELLCRVGRLADELHAVAEVDLNPVVARPDGVCAVDVKIRVEPATDHPEDSLRRLD